MTRQKSQDGFGNNRRGHRSKREPSISNLNTKSIKSILNSGVQWSLACRGRYRGSSSKIYLSLLKFEYTCVSRHFCDWRSMLIGVSEIFCGVCLICRCFPGNNFVSFFFNSLLPMLLTALHKMTVLSAHRCKYWCMWIDVIL